MHRTQILLERRQYEALRAWSRRTNRSLSALIRQAVDKFLGEEKRPTRKARLSDICGIGRDPGGPTSNELDAWLYDKLQ